MISNKLVKFTGLWKLFPAVPKYSFSQFPNKQQVRMLKNLHHTNYAKDDLSFPHNAAKWNGGVQAVCDNYKKNPDLDVSAVNVANLMYNCAVANVYEPLVFEEIERHLHKYEDKLRPRWAFGCLYGAYKTNASTLRGINFFQQELLKHINELTYQELSKLVEAISYNNLLSTKDKITFIDNNIRSLLLEKWEKKVARNRIIILLLFESLYRMQYEGKELWEPVLQAMQKLTFNNAVVINIYETLTQIQTAGFSGIDLSKDIESWKERSTINVDRQYRYNGEEQRWYSFQELKAQRETYNFPDQKLRSYAQELTEEERKRREEQEEKLAEEKRQAEREKTLNEIVKERYIQLLRGDRVTEFVGDVEKEEVSDSEDMTEAEKVYDDAEIDAILAQHEGDSDSKKQLRQKLKMIKEKKARQEAAKKTLEDDE